MSRKIFLICLIFGLSLLQVHAQVDETEIINDEIATEGSSHRMMPNDDEDYEDEDYEDEEISGSSGESIDDDEKIVKSVNQDFDRSTTTTTITTTTTKKTVQTGEEEIDVDGETNLKEKEPKADPVPANASFFQSNQFMIAMIVGGVLGLLLAVCVIALVAYRMRKKDEGSYPIADEKSGSNAYQYTQGQEYFA